MRVRPVLVKNCYACHTGSQMGGLQLDTREHVVKGGKDGPVIVAGDPDHSLLIQAVRQTHPRIKMPPGKKLSEQEIADLAEWVKNGAVWGASAPAQPAGYGITDKQRAFWSFQPVRKPAPPAVKDTAWAKTAIDRFVLAKLEAKGLKPVRAADKRTLIRRATYDLTGLPPTPAEVDAFVADKSPAAFATVVDRLLESPHYGERWGRFWLDVARYSDDKLDSERDNPYPNSFRYRDWVIKAFNDDMRYDLFVKAQIAGDSIATDDRARYEPGLGFYALSPEFQDDRVDATTRGFLGLTVACAQCHDHKFDPIPTTDYYSLLGVFNSTKLSEYPLAAENVVKAYKDAKSRIDERQKAIDDFSAIQGQQLSDILAADTARYLLASAGAADAQGLDTETFDRWKGYLKSPVKDHPYLKTWFDLTGQHLAPDELKTAAADFQKLVLDVDAEQKRVEDENHVTLGLNPNRGDLSGASLKSLARDKYVLWRDVFGDSGVLHYKGKHLDRFLSPIFRGHLDTMRTELASLQKALPPQYPFLQVIDDVPKPHDGRVYIRGSRDNLGAVVPRHFVSILSKGPPAAFTHGSGRLDLANAIADPKNPLTARVMVNRIWQHHFGQGIVRTPSNFGELGDRPADAELLDYLAARFIENKWSVKAMHREMMLTAAYQLSSANSEADYAADPDNRLVWRQTRRRLDAEALRDSILFDAGDLDLTPGGPAKRMTDDYKHRAVYGFVSRRRLDGMLALFDFPNPNNTSEQRLDTSVPLQKLFFLNSDLVMQESDKLAQRLTAASDAGKIREAYLLLFDRPAAPAEVKAGLQFLREAAGSHRAWPEYTQVLLGSNEFSFLN
ncbi:MAG: PSD1 and planctomycete cytochrome C domain-containing protein [Bryobacteraceae bacterium]